MTEEIIEQTGEQPKEVIGENVQEGIVDCGTTCPEETLGSLGKFKDTQSLLNAYNSLQAEFTKKCQKLSEAKRMLDEASLKQTEAKEDAPVFSNENWQEKVSSFLQQNVKAKGYSKEIANEILQDKDLQSSPDALQLAWARVMNKEFESPKTLAENQEFIKEQILSKPQVKEQVINEYFQNLQNVKTPPVISNKGNVAFVTLKEPTNMAEAKAMVEQIFNIKG